MNRFGSTINMSVIPAQEMPNESKGFMTTKEQNELFGSELKPDVVKIRGRKLSKMEGKGKTQSAAASTNQLINPDRMDQYQEINGEFKIERGFAGMERA